MRWVPEVLYKLKPQDHASRKIPLTVPQHKHLFCMIYIPDIVRTTLRLPILLVTHRTAFNLREFINDSTGTSRQYDCLKGLTLSKGLQAVFYSLFRKTKLFSEQTQIGPHSGWNITSKFGYLGNYEIVCSFVFEKPSCKGPAFLDEFIPWLSDMHSNKWV